MRRCAVGALPARLVWAAAPLDPERPLPVICGEPEVREFFHWLGELAEPERVSIGNDPALTAWLRAAVPR